MFLCIFPTEDTCFISSVLPSVESGEVVSYQTSFEGLLHVVRDPAKQRWDIEEWSQNGAQGLSRKHSYVLCVLESRFCDVYIVYITAHNGAKQLLPNIP